MRRAGWVPTLAMGLALGVLSASCRRPSEPSFVGHWIIDDEATLRWTRTFLEERQASAKDSPLDASQRRASLEQEISRLKRQLSKGQSVDLLLRSDGTFDAELHLPDTNGRREGRWALEDDLVVLHVNLGRDAPPGQQAKVMRLRPSGPYLVQNHPAFYGGLHLRKGGEAR